MVELESDGQVDSETPMRFSVTASEAIEKGIPCPEPPDPQDCEFCGTPLEFKGLLAPPNFMGADTERVVLWSRQPIPCSCDQAVAKAAELAAQEEAERVAQEEAEHVARIESMTKAAGIRPRFLSRTFESFEVNADNERPLKVARRYVDTFMERAAEGSGLYFVGEVGTGKTHLAVAIALALIAQGHRCLFTTSPDLLSEVRETYSGNGSEEAVLRQYRECGLLVLDDLGKESPSDWTCATLFSLVNDRYESMLPVIVTTQYDDDELCRRLGKGGDIKTAEALVSRLHEMCYRVDLVGKDWRATE